VSPGRCLEKSGAGQILEARETMGDCVPAAATSRGTFLRKRDPRRLATTPTSTTPVCSCYKYATLVQVILSVHEESSLAWFRHLRLVISRVHRRGLKRRWVVRWVGWVALLTFAGTLFDVRLSNPMFEKSTLHVVSSSIPTLRLCLPNGGELGSDLEDAIVAQVMA